MAGTGQRPRRRPAPRVGARAASRSRWPPPQRDPRTCVRDVRSLHQSGRRCRGEDSAAPRLRVPSRGDSRGARRAHASRLPHESRQSHGAVDAGVGDYRAGDEIWCRPLAPEDYALALNRDVLVPRPAGRFLFGRLIGREELAMSMVLSPTPLQNSLRPPDEPPDSTTGVLPPDDLPNTARWSQPPFCTRRCAATASPSTKRWRGRATRRARPTVCTDRECASGLAD